MRRSAYSDSEIIAMVRDVEAGRPADEMCQTAGITLRTLYRWRRRFGGLKPFAVHALRALEQENYRLKAEAAHRAIKTISTTTSPSRVTMRSDLGGGRVSSGVTSATVVGRYAALRVR
ncbi:transposase [Lichenihabitans psoromatis]|uniref:transposase n=1 Tax=Lichenihabitans psoromatis TaxID=2528642 RepID=UPI0010360E92|nr:transposase [Lichenihabitans psoromatis]